MTALSFACTLRRSPQFTLDARFECARGVTAIFGPSGSGKTTVLHAIAGLVRPSGKIVLDGQTLLDSAARVFLKPERRRIALVFQDHLLFPHLSVKQNLTYGVRGAQPVDHDFDKLVHILDIQPLVDRYPHSLSGGQRQRVALGRAILARPRMLLLDEPLAALDEPLKDRILTYLERVLGEYHTPTLFVSHDQTDVRRLAEEVIVLENGRVVAAGPTRETLDKTLLGPLSSLTTPVNLVRVSHVRQADGHWEGTVGSQVLSFTAFTRSFTASSNALSEALVQFRPSDVSLTRGVLAGVSIRNQLRGTVRQVVLVGNRAFVSLDIGEPVWAEVVHEVLRELLIEPGAELVCLIKAAAVQAVG
jgi:molybdate transport system ATP-binding protein